MIWQKSRQSIRALVGVVAVAATFGSLWSLRQEQGRQRELERARLVVREQLEAFREGDYRTAFRFAAETFHREMSITEFKRMVIESYPAIAHPREFRFGEARWDAGKVLVEVLVIGANGRAMPHLYALGRERDGWKVEAVSGGLTPQSAPRRVAPPVVGSA